MGRKPKSNIGVFSVIRPLLTVVILSAFVLGISFFVKTLATSDIKSVVHLVRPLLSKLNIDEVRAGQVAGEFATRLSQTGISNISSSVQNNAILRSAPDSAISKDTSSTKIAFLADSHDNNINLAYALKKAKDMGAEFVFYLGDYTDFGEIDTLINAKNTMDAGGIDYLSLPGDHDLYKSVGPENFIKVFGKNHFVKTINSYKFVALDNSANFTTINSDIFTWFKTEVKNADFVVLSQPLYHPTFNVVMGVVNGEENVSVRSQAVELLSIIRNSNVKAIIAADQHLASVNIDPQKSSLAHIVVGALTEQRNLQTPRFLLFMPYVDGTYKTEDVLLK